MNTDSFFNDSELSQVQNRLLELQTQVHYVELQKAALLLHQFIMDHRDITGFGMVRTLITKDGKIHLFSPEALFRVSSSSIATVEPGLMRWHTYCRNTELNKALHNLGSEPVKHHSALFDALVKISFVDLHLISDGDLLPFLMKKLLGESFFSKWEHGFLNQNLSPVATQEKPKSLPRSI